HPGGPAALPAGAALSRDGGPGARHVPHRDVRPAGSVDPAGRSAAGDLMGRRTRRLGPAAALAAMLALPAALAAQQSGGPPAPAAETELVFEREAFQYPSFPRMNPFVPLDAGAGGPRFEQLSLIGVVYAGPGGRSVAVLSTGGVTVNQDGTISPRAGEAF